MSIGVFSTSLILLLVRWKEKAQSHADAVKKLFELKHETWNCYREECKEERKTKFDALMEEYKREIQNVPSIPEHFFLPLKSRHKKKVMLSKFINENEGKPFWYIKICFLLKRKSNKNTRVNVLHLFR